MVLLDNYIYYSICDKSYDIFKRSAYSTYRNFCNNIKHEIESNSGSLHTTTNFIFWQIGEYIKVVYDLDFNQCLDYIFKYFINEKYKTFEEPMVCIKSAYKNSFN